jgi:hypothetical protein
LLQESLGITFIGILHALAQQDGHGQLGQIVTRQHIDGSTTDHGGCRIHAISEKATAIGDANGGCTHEEPPGNGAMGGSVTKAC